MKSILYIFAILIPSIGWCQNNPDTLEFYPLTFIEKVSGVNEIKSLIKADSLNKKDYFFTEQYKDDIGLFLINKENENWFVYDFGLSYGSNCMIKEFKLENNRFVSIQVFRFPSGACSSTYGIIVLFDLINNKWTDFWNFNRFECYNENAEVSSSSECKVDFSIKDNFLKMTSSKEPDDGLYCFENGTYKYDNGNFVKIEYANKNKTITNEEGVIINGVKWATRNVDIPGKFTENPEDFGMFYQWNRKFAWNSTDKNVTNWNGISSYGDSWKKDNDPSPIGWRVPTKDEIVTLLDTNFVNQEWININDIYGRRFTDKTTGNSIFLPTTGDRYYSNGALRAHNINDSKEVYNGTYWSSSQFRSDHAYYLFFHSKGAGWSNNHLKYGRSIRPVKDSEDVITHLDDTLIVDECFDEFISYFLTNGKFQIVRCGIIDEEEILKLFESQFVNYIYYFSNSYEKKIENCEEDVSNEKYLSIINTEANKKIILSFKKIEGRWFLIEKKDFDFEYSNIENFEGFFYQFSTDSSFRNKHINYPLKYSDLDSDYEIKTDYLTSKNKLQFDFFDTNKFKYFYDNDFDYTKRVLVWLKGLENGISSYFYFEKFNDGWKLIEYQNYSM